MGFQNKSLNRLLLTYPEMKLSGFAEDFVTLVLERQRLLENMARVGPNTAADMARIKDITEHIELVVSRAWPDVNRFMEKDNDK